MKLSDLLVGKKLDKDLKQIATIISTIDSFRVGRGTKISKIEHMVHNAKIQDMPRKWKVIKRDLEEIATLPQSAPKVAFLLNLGTGLQFAGIVCFAALMLTATVALSSNAPFLQDIYFYVGTGIIVTGYVIIFARNAIRQRIRRFYEDSTSKLEGKSMHLREFNQALIEKLRSQIREGNDKPKDYRLYLYNNDYQNLVLLKKPNFIREHYEAQVLV